MIHRFGPFEADPARYELRRDGRVVDIEPQVLELIFLLVAEPRLVAKDELVERVWKGRFVTDAAVARAVQKARRALDDDATSPRWIETVHGRGYRFTGDVAVTETLAAEDAAEPTGSEPPPPASAGHHVRKPWPARVIALGLGIAAVLAAFVLNLWRAPERGSGLALEEGAPARVAASGVARPGVLVLDLSDLSGGGGDTGWLGTALAELVAAELGRGGSLRIVPRADARSLVEELELPEVGAPPPSLLAALRARTGAATVVAGGYLVAAGASPRSVHFTLSAFDASSGEALGSWSEEQPIDSLGAAVTRVAALVRAGIGSAPAPPASVADVVLPASAGAASAYADGLARLRRDEPAAAAESLERAVRLAPEFAPAHAALARARGELGEETRARAAAGRASQLSAGLPQRQQLEIEALAATIAGDHARAAAASTALWKFYPDELDYGLDLVDAQIALRRHEEARQTLEALRRLPEPLASDPRIALAEARAGAAADDAHRQQERAAAAASRAALLGARRTEAAARLEEGLAWRRLGELERAKTSVGSARELYAGLDDRNGVATSMLRLASIAHQQGRLDEAMRLDREAKSTFTALGRRGPAATCDMNLAIIDQSRGDARASEAKYLSALAVFRELGDSEHAALVLVNLISLRYSVGDLAGALRHADEGYEMARAESDRRGQADFLYRKGEVQVMAGDLPAAAENLERALAVFREIENPRGEASALNALGSVRTRQGRLEDAARLGENAIAIFRRIDDGYGLADSLNRTANTRYAQGRYDTALALYRESLAVYRRIDHRFGIGVATYGVAVSLLARGEPKQAGPLLEEALSAARQIGNRPMAGEVHRMLAELEFVRGDLAAASRHLDAAREDFGDADIAEYSRDLAKTAARVRLESEDAAGAEAVLRPELAKITSPELGDEEAELRELLGAALLAQGRVDVARAALARALSLTERSERASLRLGVEITAARVEAAAGDQRTALARLDAAAGRAGELGLDVRRLEAALARLEIRERAGAAENTAYELSSLRREAGERGLGLLARKTQRPRR